MRIELVKDLYYHICPYEYEGQKIQVFKNKKTFECVFFNDNNGDLELVDPEVALELSKEFDIKDDGHIEYKIENITIGGLEPKQKTPMNEPKFYDELEFTQYAEEVEIEVENQKYKFPYILRLEKDFDGDVEEYKGYVEESIKRELKVHEELGLDMSYILNRFNERPLSVNFYDFAALSGYIVTENNDKERAHKNSIYVSVDQLLHPKEDTPSVEVVKKGFVDTIRHEFNHVISDSKTACGFHYSNFGVGVFKAINEALTELMVYSTFDGVMRESAYSDFINLIAPTIPDRKKAFYAYHKNDFESFVKQYEDYYHCDKDQVLEFFAKLDCFANAQETTKSLFLEKEVCKTILKLKLNKKFNEDKDFFTNLSKIELKDLIDVVNPDNFMFKQLDLNKVKREFVKEEILQKYSRTVENGVVKFENGVTCSSMYLNMILMSMKLDLIKADEIKHGKTNLHKFVEYVKDSKKIPGISLSELSVDELLILAYSNEPGASRNNYLSTVLTKPLTQKQKKQVILQLGSEFYGGLADKVKGELIFRSYYQNFVNNLDRECIIYAAKANEKGFLDFAFNMLEKTPERAELYNSILHGMLATGTRCSYVKKLIKQDIANGINLVSDETYEILDEVKYEEVEKMCEEFKEKGKISTKDIFCEYFVNKNSYHKIIPEAVLECQLGIKEEYLDIFIEMVDYAQRELTPVNGKYSDRVKKSWFVLDPTKAQIEEEQKRVNKSQGTEGKEE